MDGLGMFIDVQQKYALLLFPDTSMSAISLKVQ